ncbi:MAG: VCBS repeat-containing protein, partial [Deltaproteobacteria bacterium]|nr:VCBS repeat-containing protein [Deltaproteobacteria bacterium]
MRLTISLRYRAATRRVLVAFVLGGVLASAPARAEEGTLDRLVDEVERKLVTALHGRAIARDDLALVLREGRGMRGSGGLLPTIRRLLLGRIARRGFRSFRLLLSERSGDKLIALARGKGAELLCRLTLSIDAGHLRLRGEILDVGGSLWRDLVLPRRGSLAFLFGRVRVDAEVRAFFRGKPTARRTFATRRFEAGRLPILALAAKDLDGDGHADLLALGRESVVLFDPPRGSRSRYVVRTKLSLSGPRASSVPRRVLGQLLVADLDGDRRREIYLRTSIMAQGEELRFEGGKLLVTRELSKIYPVAIFATRGRRRRIDLVAATGGDFFRAADFRLGEPAKKPATSRPAGGPGNRTPTTAPAAAGVPATVASVPAKVVGTITTAGAAIPRGLPARFYGLQTARVASATGPRYYGAAVDLMGQLHLLDGTLTKPLALLGDVGVAFDIVDLDDDGRLEVITSSGDERGLDDRIAVYRFARDKRLHLLWRSARFAGRVTALTHGDLD